MLGKFTARELSMVVEVQIIDATFLQVKKYMNKVAGLGPASPLSDEMDQAVQKGDAEAVRGRRQGQLRFHDVDLGREVWQ